MDTVLFKYLWDKGANFLSNFKQQEEEAPVRPQVGPNFDSIKATHAANSAAPSLAWHMEDAQFDHDICVVDSDFSMVEIDGKKTVLEPVSGVMVVFTAKADAYETDTPSGFATFIEAPGQLTGAEMKAHFDHAMNNVYFPEDNTSPPPGLESPRRGW